MPKKPITPFFFKRPYIICSIQPPATKNIYTGVAGNYIHIGSMNMAKKFLPERHLVQKWLETYHPNVLQWKRPRVGPIPGRAPDKYKGVRRGWPDIIFKENNIIYIVEAKVRPQAAACGQLKEYERLWPLTPEFSEFRDLPVRLISLTTRDEVIVRETCEAFGIEYVIFTTPEVEEYQRRIALEGRSV